MELKHGRLLQSNGSYTRHLELTADRNEILRRHYENQKKEIRRLEGVIEQQRRWNQAHNYVTIASKQKQIDRLKAALTPPEADTASIRFHFTAQEPGGNDVLLCDDLAKSYGQPVFSPCIPPHPPGGTGIPFGAQRVRQNHPIAADHGPGKSRPGPNSPWRPGKGRLLRANHGQHAPGTHGDGRDPSSLSPYGRRPGA